MKRFAAHHGGVTAVQLLEQYQARADQLYEAGELDTALLLAAWKQTLRLDIDEVLREQLILAKKGGKRFESADEVRRTLVIPEADVDMLEERRERLIEKARRELGYVLTMLARLQADPVQETAPKHLKLP
jgi:hypothetical protein